MSDLIKCKKNKLACIFFSVLIIKVLTLFSVKSISMPADKYVRKIQCSGILENGILYANIFDSLEKQNGVPYSDLENEVKQSWSKNQFTNPAEHNTSKFRYIVHGILDRRELELQVGALDIYSELAENILDDYDREDMESRWVLISRLLANPELISEVGSVSASVINQDHIKTFANSGFILSAEYSNIYASQTSDFGGGSGRDIRFLESQNEIYGISSSGEILRNSIDYYNEIKLAGTTPENTKLKVVGLFIKYIIDTEYLSVTYERRDKLVKLAKERDLPLIYIQDDTSLEPRSY